MTKLTSQIGLILGTLKPKNFKRLLGVLSLFDEKKIVHNFSNMNKLMESVTIKTKSKTDEWEEDLSELPENYQYDDKKKSMQEWLLKTKTTSLLVVKDGKIVYENYYLGTQKNDKRISWSIAKSFLSALFGIAVDSGLIESIEDPVTKYVPEFKNSAYDKIPIRHVLNMSSGILFDEDYIAFKSDINKMGRVLGMGGSMDEFTLGLKERERESGTARTYTSIDTHVLAMVLRAVTNKTLPELMEEQIWSKLGPEDDAYFLTDGPGVAFALGGLNMQTRDYARFGQLFLDKGKWKGRQIIPESWAVESVKKSAKPSSKKYDKVDYAYQWWVPVDADEEFYGIGVYGQYLYINRKTRVVVVKTSAHREFREDDAEGYYIERENIEMLRALSTHF